MPEQKKTAKKRKKRRTPKPRAANADLATKARTLAIMKISGLAAAESWSGRSSSCINNWVKEFDADPAGPLVKKVGEVLNSDNILADIVNEQYKSAVGSYNFYDEKRRTALKLYESVYVQMVTGAVPLDKDKLQIIKDFIFTTGAIIKATGADARAMKSHVVETEGLKALIENKLSGLIDGSPEPYQLPDGDVIDVQFEDVEEDTE